MADQRKKKCRWRRQRLFVAKRISSCLSLFWAVMSSGVGFLCLLLACRGLGQGKELHVGRGRLGGLVFMLVGGVVQQHEVPATLTIKGKVQRSIWLLARARPSRPRPGRGYRRLAGPALLPDAEHHSSDGSKRVT